VRDRRELDERSPSAPDFILLDNMSAEELRRCVEKTGGRVALETSEASRWRACAPSPRAALTGISVGALTHSVRALDISMRVEL